jgi:excisionase family DNA binding protein
MTTHADSETRLLPVSEAARMLGVSTSSLRAWAAAGRVPHVRTRGGHRRFDPAELRRWLAERGAPDEIETPTPAEPVGPVRFAALPELGRALREHADEVVTRAERRLSDEGVGGGRRPAAARRARLADEVASLADSLDEGDLTAPLREAEWEGFRHGAGGLPGELPMSEALAMRRAVDVTLQEACGRRADAERRAVERLLDRIAVRVAAGYAEGLRSRLRTRR